MLNLSKRIKKLEVRHTDHSGHVPYSDDWVAFWEDGVQRIMAGEDLGGLQIPLEVIDWIVREAEGKLETANGRGASPMTHSYRY